MIDYEERRDFINAITSHKEFKSIKHDSCKTQDWSSTLIEYDGKVFKNTTKYYEDSFKGCMDIVKKYIGEK